MMIKKICNFGVLLMCGLLMAFSSASLAKGKLTSTTFPSEIVYYGQTNVGYAEAKYYITFSTPSGVGYGVYKTVGIVDKGDTLTLESWNGSNPAPTLVLANWTGNVDESHCPGLVDRYWDCGSQTIKVTVEADDANCPWVASLYMITTAPSNPVPTYTGPATRGTVCPTIPISTYDVSWSPDSVQHDKVVSVDATGGTVNTQLSTYLMESGTLCDGSKSDTRASYCRVVATGVTLSVLGCDNSIVTTTATAHPITDKALHDINVAVNTKDVGTGMVKSTCSFQYIIDEL